MSQMRLKSGIWVAAYIRRCQVAGAFVAVRRRGADEAGAIFIKLNRLDGTAEVYGPAPQTGPIGLDFSNTQSLAGTSAMTLTGQNGYQAGTLSNITIGQDGTISGAFTNGQSNTLGRVAIATFQNEQGLQRIGGSDFGATANSGLAQVGNAGSGRFLYTSINSGSLEQSNVSIADEFTKMIAAQSAYQANSKSITTASEDMQTVIGLIR